MRVIVAVLVMCSIALPTYASDTPRSAAARAAWTLAGVGIGFGVGTYIGFAKFDDATYAERKITTTAISCAAAGGIIAFLLTRNRGRSPSTAASSSPKPSVPIRP